jgi:UDP-hydrolysing UDP-N-acetyl-D-glucosamine 2-epimerase
MQKRKIAVVIGSRANYASIKSVMKEIQKYPQDLELLLFVGASSLLDKYGKVIEIITRDGFPVTEKFYMLVEGETPETMAMSVGVGLLELPNILANHKPDVVITIGDRFETLSTAISTVFMNIHLAHTMGGEVTGTIDESIRHAITKFAHLHFAANEDAKERIIKMGENPEFVFNTGCPRIDEVKRLIEENRANPKIDDNFFAQYKGVGPELKLEAGKFLIVMQHPVTTEYGKNREHMRNILSALQELSLPTILIWPNADAGSDEISKEIRTFREKESPSWLHAFTNLPFEVFIPLMDTAGCIVGNSSSPVREGAIIGIPTVNIGTREQGRMRGRNVMDVGYEKEEILLAIKKQFEHGKYEPDYIYGDGKAGERIIKILKEIDFSRVPIQKMIYY